MTASLQTKGKGSETWAVTRKRQSWVSVRWKACRFVKVHTQIVVLFLNNVFLSSGSRIIQLAQYTASLQGWCCKRTATHTWMSCLQNLSCCCAKKAQERDEGQVKATLCVLLRGKMKNGSLSLFPNRSRKQSPGCPSHQNKWHGQDAARDGWRCYVGESSERSECPDVQWNSSSPYQMSDREGQQTTKVCRRFGTV